MSTYFKWLASNVRRRHLVKKFRNALALENYRKVFIQDKGLMFVYKINPSGLFIAPYQISILNLFALQKLDLLTMDY